MILCTFNEGERSTEVKRRYKEKYYINDADDMQLVAKIVNMVRT